MRSGSAAGGELPVPPPGRPDVFCATGNCGKSRRCHDRGPGHADDGRRGGHGSAHDENDIAAGKIGNDRPISIVTEVWTSPELQTVVLSKRNDPRMGERTVKLTNIQRGEPDASLFTVPADFKTNDNGAGTVVYRTKQ